MKEGNKSLSEKTTKAEWHKAYNKMCQKYGKLVRKNTDLKIKFEEKIQNVQRGIEIVINTFKTPTYNFKHLNNIKLKIDKIFLEEFGRKLI